MKKLFLFIYTLFTLNGLFSQQNITICEESQNTFIYNTGTNQVGNYYWFVDGIEQTTNISSIIINWQNYPFGFHTIEVWFESQFGCESSPVSYTVTTSECNNSTMYVPNAFTPDGDQYNNQWKPIGYNVNSIHFTIFNRWGETLFESYNPNYGWDGTYNGKICQDGVYTYKIEWTDNKNYPYIKHGHIVLIK